MAPGFRLAPRRRPILVRRGGQRRVQTRAAPGGRRRLTDTPLYTFPVDSGPVGDPLAVGAGGTLFGVTASGGYVGGFCAHYQGCGTVFSLTPPATAGGLWTEQILHAFNPGGGDGNHPAAGLVIGPGGVLYGTTLLGGEGYEEGGGTVFSLTPPAVAGAPMTETIVYQFGVAEGDGVRPSRLLCWDRGECCMARPRMCAAREPYFNLCRRHRWGEPGP